MAIARVVHFKLFTHRQCVNIETMFKQCVNMCQHWNNFLNMLKNTMLFIWDTEANIKLIISFDKDFLSP